MSNRSQSMEVAAHFAQIAMRTTTKKKSTKQKTKTKENLLMSLCLCQVKCQKFVYREPSRTFQKNNHSHHRLMR